MKTIRPLFPGVFLAAATALLAGCAMQPRPESLTVTVVRIKGAAQFSKNGKTWQPLKINTVLKVGTTVQTAPQSRVDIVFDYKPGPLAAYQSSNYNLSPAPRLKFLRMFENSALKIEQAMKENRWSSNVGSNINFREEVKLNLYTGVINGGTVSSSANPKFEVQFTNGMVTLSGDVVYIITASGTVEVVGGTASVFLADKNTTTEVLTRQKFDPVSGTVTDMPLSEIVTLSPIHTYRLVPDPEAATQPPALGHGPGMGGALRKF